MTPIGLHHLLIHDDIPVVDPGDWRLLVDGRCGQTVRANEVHRVPVTGTDTFTFSG
ncbi:MAG TPA: hypothetical protein VFA46_11300 [Actinomycetes bacterium]|nr:hypothetical protein [Actinomycetes bacterium]